MRKLGVLFILCITMVPQVAQASTESINGHRLNLGFSLGRYVVSGDGFAAGGMGGIHFPIVGVVRGELTVSLTHLSFKPVSFIQGSGDRVGGRTLGFQFGATIPITL